MEYYDKISIAAQYLEQQLDYTVKHAIILGTGLGDFVQHLHIDCEIAYDQIPHFPVSTVKGHSGKLILGKIEGTPVIVFSGRFHYYEGYDMKTLTLPVRVLARLGIENVYITNVAGGVNAEFNAGDLVVIRDHINFMPENPLRGVNDDRLGPRFPDMTYTYSKNLMDKAFRVGGELELNLKSGVYFSWQGPNLETPAEYEMIHRLGGDLVGMSTVPEVIAAKHSGLNIFAASIVSNECYPLERIRETSVEDVIEVAKLGGKKLSLLLSRLIP